MKYSLKAIRVNAKENQDIEKIIKHDPVIVVEDRSIYLNGNMHSIDASQVRVLTASDLTSKGLTAKYELWPVLHILNQSKVGPFQVNLYDLSIKTNSKIKK